MQVGRVQVGQNEETLNAISHGNGVRKHIQDKKEDHELIPKALAITIFGNGYSSDKNGYEARRGVVQ